MKTKRKPNKPNTDYRIPRPTGTSILILQNKERELIRRNIIKQYIANNYILNNRPYNLLELAIYLGTSESYVQSIINRYNKVQSRSYAQKANPDEDEVLNGSLARGAAFSALKNHQQMAEIARRQAAQLFQEQGGTYVPFLSSAANQAIATALVSHKGLVDLLTMMQPKQPSIAILNNNQIAQSSHLTIGTSEALKIIEDKVKAIGIGSSAHVALLAQSHDFHNFPDITSNTQSEQALEAHLIKKAALKEVGEADTSEYREARKIQEEMTNQEVHDAFEPLRNELRKTNAHS